MAMPIHDDDDLDLGDIIPPELAADEPPVDPDDLEAWIGNQVKAAAAAGTDPADLVAADLARLIELQEQDRLSELGDRGDLIPESVLAFATGELDADAMEYAMSRLHQVQARVEVYEGRAWKMKARVDRWFDRHVRAGRAEAAYFEGLLIAQARRAHEADPDVKSISLVGGKVKSSGPRKGNEHEVIVTGDTKPAQDAAAAEVIAWCEEKAASLQKEADVVRARRDEEHEQGSLEWVTLSDELVSLLAEVEEILAAVKVTKSVLVSKLRDTVTVVGGAVVYAPTGEQVPGTAVRTKVRTWKVELDKSEA